jgi:hypothetical protein
MPRPASASHIVDLDNNRTVSRWLSDEAVRPKNLTVSVPDPLILTEHLQEAARHFAPDVTFIDVAGTYERALTMCASHHCCDTLARPTAGGDLRSRCGVCRRDQPFVASGFAGRPPSRARPWPTSPPNGRSEGIVVEGSVSVRTLPNTARCGAVFDEVAALSI